MTKTAVYRYSRTHRCSNTCECYKQCLEDRKRYGFDKRTLMTCIYWFSKHHDELPYDVREEQLHKTWKGIL